MFNRERRKIKYMPDNLIPKYKPKVCAYKWCNQENRAGISCHVDIPIVKIKDELLIIDKSCIILNDENEIINIIIYESEDPNIGYVLKNYKKMYQLSKKYMKKKDGAIFYGGRWEGNISNIPYGGENYLYGVQRFLHPKKKSNKYPIIK